MGSLTNKQQAFVEEYLKDFNATQAALRAGYAESSARLSGHRNITNDNIAAEIRARIAEKAMTADEVLLRLAEQARGEHSQYLTAEGVDLRELIADGKGHLVKRIKETKYGLDIEFYDAQSALVHIGRHHAIFTDKVKHESWQDEVVALLRDGRVTPDDVAAAYPDLAAEFFAKAGINAGDS